MPFAKGNNANPRGRPKKGETLSDLLRVELRKKGPDGRPNKTAVLQALIDKATAGDIGAIKVVLDRTDGAVPQPVEHTGKDGNEILLRYVNDWRSNAGD